MIFSCIPKELLHKILEYDGKIKYRNGKYIDVIHKHDYRYSILQPLINKKMEIMKNTEIIARNSTICFYFEIPFNVTSRTGLSYDYNFSHNGTFEICYYDMREGWIQIRTLL